MMPPRRRRTRWRVDSCWGLLDFARLGSGSVKKGCETNLLDVVVAKGTAIFELLAGENQTLLVGWDAFFVLDFGFDVVDCVGGLDLERDGLAREGLDEAGLQSQYEVVMCGSQWWRGNVVPRREGDSYICTVRLLAS